MPTTRRKMAAAIGLLLALSPPAAAQPGRDPAAADEAFRAAVAAKLSGDLKTACAKFQASLQLDPAVSTLLNVAECLEQEGKLARAWSEAQRARVLNAETPGEQRRRELDSYATVTIERLRAKLAWVQIVLKNAPADTLIERDGVALPAALLDQPIPADPGRSTVRATAPGHEPFRIDLSLSEGKTAEVTIALKPSPAALKSAVTGSVSPPGGSASATAPPGSRPLWPWLVGGAGLALIGVGVGFAVSEAGTQADIDKNCHQQPDGRCRVGYPYQGQNDRLYRDFGLAIGFAVGGALAAAAGIIGLVRGSERPPPRAVVIPVVSPHGGGLSIGGAF